MQPSYLAQALSPIQSVAGPGPAAWAAENPQAAGKVALAGSAAAAIPAVVAGWPEISAAAATPLGQEVLKAALKGAVGTTAGATAGCLSQIESPGGTVSSRTYAETTRHHRQQAHSADHGQECQQGGKPGPGSRPNPKRS